MTAATRAGTALAMTGMACRYPHADGIEALWRCMQGPQAPMASRRLGPSSADPGAFGIPPIYRHSINDVQLDLLALSRDALAQAGLDADAIDRERTDVIFCHALGMNRQYENYARIAAVAWAEPVWANAGDGANTEWARAAWKRKLDALFRATSHDKVGEMASTMPARVASHFRLRGRALALEAQERSAIEGLLAAWDAIATGRAQTVLLLGAQSLASPSLEALLRERLPAPLADALCEGACALVLQDAHLAGARAIACIDAVDVDGQVSGGPQAPVRVQVLDGVDTVAVTGEAAPDAVVQAHQACGYGYAMQPLTALLQAALIQQRGRASGTPPVAPDGLSVTVQGAAKDGHPYRIALRAAHVANVANAAHETKRPYDGAMPTPVAPAAPVAVVAMGTRFGDGRDMADYWEALRSPRTASVRYRRRARATRPTTALIPRRRSATTSIRRATASLPDPRARRRLISHARPAGRPSAACRKGWPARRARCSSSPPRTSPRRRCATWRCAMNCRASRPSSWCWRANSAWTRPPPWQHCASRRTASSRPLPHGVP